MRSILLVSLLCLTVSVLAEPITISGVVVDGDGNPVAGADVHLVRRLLEPSYDKVLVTSVKSDDAGTFTIAGIEHDSPLYVGAFAQGLALGAAFIPEGKTECRLVCAKPVPASVKLVGADGEPVTGTCAGVHIYCRGEPRWSLSFPTELCERYGGALDDTGTLAPAWLPANTQLNVQIRTPDHGTVRVTVMSGDTKQFTLSPPGSIRGRITCKADPGAAAGIKVSASGYYREAMLGASGEMETDAEGRFEFPAMLPLPTTIWFQFAADPKWAAKAPEAFTIKSGETVEFNIEMEPTYEVRGRVIDQETGEGMADVQVNKSSEAGPNTGVSSVTDKDGYYTARLLPGEVTFYVAVPPEDYRANYEGTRQTVQVTDTDAVAPDIALEKGVALAGIVVDKDGKPVAGANIYSSTSGEMRGPFSPAKSSDADGKFEITNLAPDKEVTLRARLDDRMTPRAVTAKPGQEEPIRLVLEDNVACSLTIRVLDDEGKPVEGAGVAGEWDEGNLSTREPQGKTGPDGRFIAASLWPIGSYQISVVAPGHSSAKTNQWVAVPGTTHDFGEVTLTAARGSLAGRVLDADDNPVAGANVSCPEGGPQPVSTVSDDAGGFRLERLFSGTVAVIAEKDDLFGGALLTASTEDGVLTVTPEPQVAALGEPQVTRSWTTQQTDWKVAQELIEEALELAKNGAAAERYLSETLGALARIDADRAFAVAAEYGSKYDDSLFVSLGEYLLDKDPDEAITYLQSIGNDSLRVYLLRRAARNLTAADPDRARAILDDAIPQCLGMSQPKYQACYLAGCAEALYRLDPEAAEGPIRKAAELAENLSYDDWEAYARGSVAEALCLIDLDAALVLIEGITDANESTRHQPNMAARLAATQPERALELMASIPESRQSRQWPRVLYNMAATHPDKAVEAARGIKDTNARTRTLGYLACAIRERNPKLALEVFQEAWQSLAASTGASRDPYEATQWAARCADLAQIAVRIGYPNPERIAWRAIVANRAREPGPWAGSSFYDGQYVHNIAFAVPDLALALAEAQGPAAMKSTEPYSDARDNYLIAAACLDANLAAEFLHMIPDDDPKAENPAKPRAYSSVISYLVMTPEERYIEAMSHYGEWVPGVVDAD